MPTTADDPIAPADPCRTLRLALAAFATPSTICTQTHTIRLERDPTRRHAARMLSASRRLNMQENVGTMDRWIRGVVGSLLIGGAATAVGRRQPLVAAALMATGAVLLETAITRVCPVNALLGVDTRHWDSARPLPLVRGQKRSSWLQEEGPE